MTDTVEHENGVAGRKAYEPSRALFLVMLAVIVAALAVFIVVGPLKGGGGSGATKSTSTPSSKH